MKTAYLFAAIAAFAGVEAAATSVYTVCSSCPTPTSTNDIVTRSDEPVVACSVPLIVPVNGTSTSSGAGGVPAPTGGVTGTPPPVPAGANQLAGVLGSTFAVALAAALAI